MGPSWDLTYDLILSKSIIGILGEESVLGAGEGQAGEAVFTRESITKEDPPNAHQGQHRPKPQFYEHAASVHP